MIKLSRGKLLQGSSFLKLLNTEVTNCQKSVKLRETLEKCYLTFEAQKLCIANWQAQKYTPPVHKLLAAFPCYVI